MYQRTPVYNLDGVAVPGLRVPVVYEDPSDRHYVVDQLHAGRWDLLAHELLGDAELWWVLCDLNKVMDPQASPLAGDRIRVPALQRLKTLT